MLQPGDPAPGFELPDHLGGTVSLDQLRGSWVVLWWFPKAGTPGCTREGHSFTELADEFAAAGAVVLGASYDTPEDNREFAESQGFRFRLLSDTERSVGPAYGTAKDPAEPFPDSPRRVSALIAPDGTVARSYLVSDAGGHPAEVLADLRALAGAGE